VQPSGAGALLRQPAGGAPGLREQHAFLDVAKRYDFARVQALVLASPGLVNCQPAGRWSALHQAAHCGNVQAVRFLLDHGASTRARTRDGLTPLELAQPGAFELLAAADAAFAAEEDKLTAQVTSNEALASMRMWRFSGSSSPACGEGGECQICLEELAEGDELRTLPCGHFFHTACVDVWLRQKSGSCPTCRCALV